MRIALDSNVLLYWLGLARRSEDTRKVAEAERIVLALSGRHKLLMPGQALGEAYNVLTKYDKGRELARERLIPALKAYDALTPTVSAYRAALDLAVDHKLQFWDALIIRVAIDAGCDLLLSEDMQDGFRVGGLTIANPFAAPTHARLAALLAE